MALSVKPASCLHENQVKAGHRRDFGEMWVCLDCGATLAGKVVLGQGEVRMIRKENVGLKEVFEALEAGGRAWSLDQEHWVRIHKSGTLYWYGDKGWVLPVQVHAGLVTDGWTVELPDPKPVEPEMRVWERDESLSSGVPRYRRDDGQRTDLCSLASVPGALADYGCPDGKVMRKCRLGANGKVYWDAHEGVLHLDVWEDDLVMELAPIRIYTPVTQ